MAARSRALVASLVVLLCVFGTEPTDSRSAGEVPVCIEAGWAGGDLDDLIGAAVEILRQSGHDPRDYRLDLRMERSPGAGFADRRVQSYPSVVFHPDDEADRYPLRVDRNNPCSVSWVWRPHRFTPWQRRVIERAREVLRDAWPGGSDEELSDVNVVETAEEVTVRLLWGELDEAGLAPSRAEITLRKGDLSPVD